jgi:hypothetical protein
MVVIEGFVCRKIINLDNDKKKRRFHFAFFKTNGTTFYSLGFRDSQ